MTIKTVKDAIQTELNYFYRHPVYSTLPSELLGTSSLISRVSKILYEMIQKALPRIQKEIVERKKKARPLRGPPPKLGMSKANMRKVEEQRKAEEEKKKKAVAEKKKQDAAKSAEGQSKNGAPQKPKAPAGKVPAKASAKPPAKAPAKAPAKPPAKK